MGNKFGFENEKRYRQNQQSRPEPVNRKNGKRREADKRENRAGGARKNSAGRSEFHVDAEHPEKQQDQREVGVADGGEKLLPQIFLISDDCGAAQVKRLFAAIKARDLTAVELTDQILVVMGGQLDQMR